MLPNSLAEIDLESLGEAEIIELSKLLRDYTEAENNSGIDKWFVEGTPYSIDNCPKHKAFFDASGKYNELLFCAANRVGKSLSGAYAMACHLTGVYPSWWTGRRWSTPIRAWAAGSDAKSTRDTVQKELIGPIGSIGSGLLPLHKMGKAFALSGVPQGIDTIQVKHISGGWSTLVFKNYQQATSAFYGTAIDYIWLDEIAPAEIYNECLIRTMTTNGIVAVTFTPLEGITPLVVNFFAKADLLCGAKGLAGVSKEEMDKIADSGEKDARLIDKRASKCIITASWDDAPWLSENAKERMLDDTPPYLRAARSRGEPAMGSGSIYPISLDEVLVKPFAIPDYYEIICGFDVGWNNTAAIWIAKNPDTEVYYVYDEYLMKQEEPVVHAHALNARGPWIPVMIDPASRGRSQVDGAQLMQKYKELGINLYPAKNEVETGLLMIWNMLATGKLKLFSNLANLHREYTLYRRDLNGKVIKENDHLLDAMRYALMSPSRMISKKEATKSTAGAFKKTTIRYDI
jgi:phage terminase large subunit-like protein